MAMYQDETLICEDCGKEFTFTAGEQEFYAEKGLINKPKRCQDCRKAKKQQHRGKKRMFDALSEAKGMDRKYEDQGFALLFYFKNQYMRYKYGGYLSLYL